MKNISLMISAAVFLLSYSQSIQAKYVFIAKDDSQATKLCVATGNNDLSQVKKSIKKLYLVSTESNKRARVATLSIQCNDLNLVEFAANFDANDTFDYFNKKAPKHMRLPSDEISIEDINARAKAPIQTIIVSAN
ncbi:DUF3718 domain-containing protein [Thalassotalea crassostreae]|uniref:DUF3718 domain-containing protein n=1 Tax=Thalassotalea crassostreae TaxID=1763536 RepID=UPI0008389330|nr:DUF3718 domain-containing protein [Thalassotalea crassostreae]